jgi:hypothetical protein
MTKRIAIAELEGVALAQAVADATKAWEIAHEWFPTMTLDPKFIRAEIRNGYCVLVPRNPMRQDPQVFDPTADWSQCGPLIERYRVDVLHEEANGEWLSSVDAIHCAIGTTPLIAACRAIVAAHNPSGFVEVPDELVEGK